MKYDPAIHHRTSNRLKEHDYSQPGHYLVTICTRHNVHMLGDIRNDKVVLNKYGNVIESWLKRIPSKYEDVIIDSYSLMPNHIHVIISIERKVGGSGGEVTSPLPEKLPTLGAIVAYFKYQTTKEINEKFGTPGEPIWHRNYFDHVIKDSVELAEIRKWIEENPKNWNKYYQTP